jgi:hypothetical protein
MIFATHSHEGAPPDAVGLTNSVGYAACAYSLISPSRMGRRCTLAAGGLGTGDRGAGGRWSRERCGRCVL